MAKSKKAKVVQPERSSGLEENIFPGEDNVFGNLFDENPPQTVPVKSDNASTEPKQVASTHQKMSQPQLIENPKKEEQKPVVTQPTVNPAPQIIKKVCPITKEPFRFPVQVTTTDKNGQPVKEIYDAYALELWAKENKTDPLTGNPITKIEVLSDTNKVALANTTSAERAADEKSFKEMERLLPPSTAKANDSTSATAAINPDDLICPITMDTFENPVRITSRDPKTGKEFKHVIEASMLVSAFKNKNENPLNRMPVISVEPALDIRKALKKENPATLSSREKSEIAEIKKFIPPTTSSKQDAGRSPNTSNVQLISSSNYNAPRTPPPRVTDTQISPPRTNRNLHSSTGTAPRFVDRQPTSVRNGQNLQSILLMAIITDVSERFLIQEMPGSRGLPPTYIYISFIMQVTSVITLESTGHLAVTILSEKIKNVSFYALIDHKPTPVQQQKIQPSCGVEDAQKNMPEPNYRRASLTLSS